MPSVYAALPDESGRLRVRRSIDRSVAVSLKLE
jgi:hypothetical protein